MPDALRPCSFSFLDGIAEVEAERWDALRPEPDPFTSHAFLSALEGSGSASVARGWQPLHLLLGERAAPAGAVPLYAKAHSWGEYVFDHGWAEAFEEAGGRYYPKLQAAVPFTPVPGPRLLARDPATRRALVAGLGDALEALELSSAHVTFCTGEEAEWFREAGWLIRRGIQYHWHNRGYPDFEAFLAALTSRRRKTIRRERREVRDAGIEIVVRTGAELRLADLEAFWPFYLATVEKRWGAAYLTRDFFRALAGPLRERVVLVSAYRRGELVAVALNLLGSDTLYGRLWGALEDYRFLHFECCYYRSIEFAIARGLARVEAGAQGTHKLLRGYEPVWTWSAHRFRDAAFAGAVERFLAREARSLERKLAELRELLPYAAPRRGG